MNTNWNPIDTAPTNLPILVGAWVHNHEEYKQWECTICLFEGKDILGFPPTHWTSIPNPPNP